MNTKNIREKLLILFFVSAASVVVSTGLTGVNSFSEAGQSGIEGDGITNRYVVMMNGASESRYWDDVTFMYYTLIDDYQYTPESIYLFNYNGNNPSGENPENMIDYPARTAFIDATFTELGNIMDSDDELLIWITGHGRGYNGPDSEYYGYLDGYASVDPGDEQDYLESEFRLRTFNLSGYYSTPSHGMDIWKVYKNYYASGHYKMWRHKYVSHFSNMYFEETNETRSDSDIFIEKIVDYLAGDYNRNGIIETSAGEVYDYDNDGVPPYDQYFDTFDEDDWGLIDFYTDDITRLNTQVPGDTYIIFDANLDSHLDIDINYDINNLEIDGTDLDNQGFFDGIDVNDDGDMDDWVSIDELIQLYIDRLSDDELAVFVDRINAGVISIVSQLCFSGGIVEDLSGPNRVIATAAEEETQSYGNIFIRNFTSAFHGASFWGTPVDADYDGNGLISMQEAFNYASFYDYYNEIPQYDDNGDGISNIYPVPFGGDGNLGANVYLVSVDNDGDGYHYTVDCNDNNPAIHPWAIEDCTDGIDNDCDSLIDTADPDAINCSIICIDADGDGYGNPGHSSCDKGAETDCNDSDYLINPGAEDAACDGIDNNCDGTFDEDYTVMSTTCGTGSCQGNTGQLECQGGIEVNTCDPFAGAAIDDSTCNGLDDDCDGSVDEDYALIPTTCGVGACIASGQLECRGGVQVDTCTPGAPQTEICGNGIDESCDGYDDICIPGDIVTITGSQWNGRKQSLNVMAVSSHDGNASLTVIYGSNSYPMTYNAGNQRFELKLRRVPYYSIINVTSSMGGSDTSDVMIK